MLKCNNGKLLKPLSLRQTGTSPYSSQLCLNVVSATTDQSVNLAYQETQSPTTRDLDCLNGWLTLVMHGIASRQSDHSGECLEDPFSRIFAGYATQNRACERKDSPGVKIALVGRPEVCHVKERLSVQ
ncbi:Secondary metabolism regulator LAE1 [Fusarium oxysporum f. sp. albedinis]|nr:Secondary metabolism regulator LAE1 [Fusarium oxysporum f. sp. albedinis]